MDVNIATLDSVIARYALVVYTDPMGQSGCIMQHALSIHDGKPALAEGIPVTDAVIKSMMQLNAVKSLQLLPTHLMALGVNSMAWVEDAPPGRCSSAAPWTRPWPPSMVAPYRNPGCCSW